jgi:hypothetical protein
MGYEWEWDLATLDFHGLGLACYGVVVRERMRRNKRDFLLC